MEVDITSKSDFSLCSQNTSIFTEEMEEITTKLQTNEKQTIASSDSVRRVRVVVSLVGKLVLPAVVRVYYAYLRNKHTLIEVLPTILAFLTNGIAKSLSSVQGAVTYPSNKIDPFLRVIKLRYRATGPPTSDTPEVNQIESSETSETAETSETDRCVTCTVLFEPQKGDLHTCDVVFIHGLHGSLVKTWRQGDWKMAKERAESVELRRRASTSCLQNSTKPHLLLKRSASTTSGEFRSKIPKAEPTIELCTCRNDLCPEFHLNNNQNPENGPGSKSECWPRDWLPKDCPGVRVIALTYTTDPYLWRPVWIKGKTRTNMEERSNEMMEHLLRIGVGKRPIVWVGHSKGGLFIKQMIVDSWKEETKEICLQTKAILFYSVPHKGSSLADFNLPLVRQSVELLEIKKDCNKVLDLHQKFLKLLDEEDFNPEIFSFIETSLTFMAFMYIRIVSFDSCDPGVGMTCGVPLDHREICKPTSRDCFLYQQLIELIEHST